MGGFYLERGLGTFGNGDVDFLGHCDLAQLLPKVTYLEEEIGRGNTEQVSALSSAVAMTTHL